MTFDSKTLAFYPEQPGVYLMKDDTGRVLYVGKGKNLRARLKTYFSTRKDSRDMIPYLIAQVKTIDTIVTLTEKEALLLENQLIKQHHPKYNVLLKDDKSYISLVLTQHQWPMLRLMRFKEPPSKTEGMLFGPYTSASAARQTLDLITRLFPLRQCSNLELVSRTRPCLLYDIGRCIAPCVGKCSKEEYQLLVNQVIRFLKGDMQELVTELKCKMERASAALEFEKAALILKTIRQIEHVTDPQVVELQGTPDCDVLSLYREGNAVLIAQLMFRAGKLQGSEHFSFHLIASSNIEIFESFLVQHYMPPSPPNDSEQLSRCPKCQFLSHERYTGKRSLPAEILLSETLPSLPLLQEILQVPILTPRRGIKKKWVEIGLKNAKALFVREQDTKSLKEKMLLELTETLQLTRFPKIIECLDTSHLAGKNAVASLVCFVDGEKEKKRMRLFKIRGEGDDYSAMREVLLRHFAKEKERDHFCDLLILDGGKGQLGIAMEVFQELGIASVDLMAIAKEEARHDKGLTQEKIYVPHKEQPILINPHSPLLFLLQRIRDEAHAKAISYHKKRRSQRILHSALDDLPGIGPVKKQRLLAHFKSVARIKEATMEELQQVGKLSKRDLETIRLFK